MALINPNFFPINPIRRGRGLEMYLKLMLFRRVSHKKVYWKSKYFLHSKMTKDRPKLFNSDAIGVGCNGVFKTESCAIKAWKYPKEG